MPADTITAHWTSPACRLGEAPHWDAGAQMFLGAKWNSVGATADRLIPIWPADAVSDQFVKGANAIEPYLDPDTFDAHTRCSPL
ncbi:hypothetical protein BIV23_02125 [Streptomyces monashensis]|uniref:Uncharacterized protein n=1 Tax=Streptomyces monashensis TaxID=1678012 RepID=A0A1S2QQP5_9ACTN|nr:hypothetical protein BIV23_02125 [Streptomyces monashensis]